MEEEFWKILFSNWYRSIQRKAYSRAYGRWENGSRGNLPFPEWNAETGRWEGVGYRGTLWSRVGQEWKMQRTWKDPGECRNWYISSWDFVLLDKDDQRIGNAVAIAMTARKEWMRGLSHGAGGRTAIDRHSETIFNSIYQLMAWRRKTGTAGKADVADDSGLPEFPAFRRESAGIQMQQRPSSSIRNRGLEQGDDSKLGYPEKIFLPIREPGTVIGRLKKKLKSRSAFDCEIVLPATRHRLRSSRCAKQWGTCTLHQLWNLVSDGTELKEADCGTEAMQHNLPMRRLQQKSVTVSEKYHGSVDGPVCEKEIAEDLSFGTICEMASNAPSHLSWMQTTIVSCTGTYDSRGTEGMKKVASRYRRNCRGCSSDL